MSDATAPILIVEDSATQALKLQFILEQQGYNVLVAFNGKQAMTTMEKHTPRLVISDIQMPEMNGYETCRAIKESAALREVPVLLLSTLSDPADIILGLQAGADYYLTKPYNQEFLLTTVKTLLENPTRAAGDDAGAGLEVTVDGHRYTVTADHRQMLNLLLSTYGNAVQQNRELIKTQQRLESIQANHRALLENNADAMVVVDRQGIVRFVNPAAKALFGREAQQLLGDLLSHAGAVGQTMEMEVPREDAEPIAAEVRVVETEWEGAPATLATLRDATARKQLERQVADLRAQLQAELRQKDTGQAQ